MQIKRSINGQTHVFDLTSSELYDAYREQEFQFDRCDIEDVFNAFDDDELMDYYGVSRKKLESLIDDMAVEMRRNMDKYDMSWDYARDEAIRTILKQKTAYECNIH